MRPLYLKFAAFGPYKDCQEIDFAQLWDKGLFLICGETGSGKTMILDAMTFALYGKSSGNMRDELEALRCRQSDWGQDTFVEFTFEIQGACYRFERRLECKRKNLTTAQNAYKQNQEGVFEPLFENCKKGDMDALAKDLIGLDYDQFRQVIVLPQGQFEKLLTSGSDEKEKILMRIFGVDKWQKLADYFYAHADARLNKLKDLRENMLRSLGEEECGSLQEFQEQIACLEEQLADWEQEYLRLGYEGRKQALEQEKDLGKAFSRMHQLEEELQVLETQEDIQVKRLEKRALAKCAEQLRPIFDRMEALAEEQNRRRVLAQELKLELERANTELERKKEQLEQLNSRREEMTLLSQEIPLYRQKRTSYENLSLLCQTQASRKKDLTEATGELERRNKTWEMYEQRSVTLKEEFERISR
ncbi:MAG: AAA family ATPase, partial [Lachnospiraceae bacterium]|nr:AAA family ATPase [Lachnospiraceae bacterium]